MKSSGFFFWSQNLVHKECCKGCWGFAVHVEWQACRCSKTWSTLLFHVLWLKSQTFRLAFVIQRDSWCTSYAYYACKASYVSLAADLSSVIPSTYSFIQKVIWWRTQTLDLQHLIERSCITISCQLLSDVSQGSSNWMHPSSTIKCVRSSYNSSSPCFYWVLNLTVTYSAPPCLVLSGIRYSGRGELWNQDRLLAIVDTSTRCCIAPRHEEPTSEKTTMQLNLSLKLSSS